MKKILVLTDFSENAWNAIFTALKLHENTEALFFITNCFEPSFAGVLGERSKERLAVIYESLEKNSDAQLNEVLKYLNRHHQTEQHEFRKISIGKDIIDAIKEFLKENEVDLIVMGARGATGAREVFMGSNAVKVIKKIKNYPILAVPQEHDFKSLETIVFPTDFSHAYSVSELRALIDLAKCWSSEILIFQVSQELNLSETQKKNKKYLEEFLGEVNHRSVTAEMKVNVKEAIETIVENSEADMIALIKYSHTFLEKLTREPVVKKMAFKSKVPLLVLPEKVY